VWRGVGEEGSGWGVLVEVSDGERWSWGGKRGNMRRRIGGERVSSLVALLHISRPVADRASQEARKDKVERGFELPFVFEVVDEELDVGRDTGSHKSVSEDFYIRS